MSRLKKKSFHSESWGLMFYKRHLHQYLNSTNFLMFGFGLYLFLLCTKQIELQFSKKQ